MRRLAAAALLVAALATAVLVVAAAPAARAGDDLGPCDLLTRKEIRAAFGQKAGKPSSDLGPTFCQWELAPTAERARGQVNTVLETGRKARRDYRLGGELAGTDREAVEGLGKKAFFTAGTGTLFVLAKGPTLFYVQANVYDPDANRLTDGLRESLTALAERAEARV